MSQERATALGFVAVLLWGMLALLTVWSAPVPPFQLNAVCFTIGGALGLIWLAASGGLYQLRAVPLHVYGLGSLGLFGYHALYFGALRLAPAAEASLIAYLWPLLIVLLSGLLPGEKLRKGHVIGAAIGFLGAVLVLSDGTVGFDAASLSGYMLAGACALTWSSYSVVSRRIGSVPTASVAVFCLVSAALSLPLHIILETTIWPSHPIGWASMTLLGLGPVGLAFYLWDVSVKRGDIQLLGTISYAAPLVSTIVLVICGVTQPTWSLVGAAILITAGALVAARASLRAPYSTR